MRDGIIYASLTSDEDRALIVGDIDRLLSNAEAAIARGGRGFDITKSTRAELIAILRRLDEIS